MSTVPAQDDEIQRLHAKLLNARSEVEPARAKAEYVTVTLQLYGDAMRNLRAQLEVRAIGVNAQFADLIAWGYPWPEAWQYERNATEKTLHDKERLIWDAEEKLRSLERGSRSDRERLQLGMKLGLSEVKLSSIRSSGALPMPDVIKPVRSHEAFPGRNPRRSTYIVIHLQA